MPTGSHAQKQLDDWVANHPDKTPTQKHNFFLWRAYLAYCGYMQRMGLPYQKSFEKWLTIMEMN